jgi:predicted nucleic acid-binding protein
MPRYVLDTSALLTVFNEEPGVAVVVDLLERAVEAAVHEKAVDAEVLVPFIALMELDYITRQRLDADQARSLCDLVEAWPVTVVESTASWRRAAARVKASSALSLADAWICGLAIQMQAELVHKDPEYDAVSDLLACRLPYKS